MQIIDAEFTAEPRQPDAVAAVDAAIVNRSVPAALTRPASASPEARKSPARVREFESRLSLDAEPVTAPAWDDEPEPFRSNVVVRRRPGGYFGGG